MKIRNAFEPREEVNGQTFTEPSLTVPDLCYSVRQLIEDGAVGQLPPLSRLAWAVVDDPDEDARAVDSMEFDSYSDIRFSDRADAFEHMSNSKTVIEAVKARVKALKDFRARQIAKEKPLDSLEKPITALE